jgi:hypothetical protein
MKTKTRSALLAIVTVPFLMLLGCGPANRLGVVAGVAEADAESSRVCEVRRLLRSACGELRAVAAGQGNADAQMDKARRETEEAMAKWQSIESAHQREAPAAYRSHPDWHRAANEITLGIEEMRAEIVAGQAPLAFKTCGSTCGKFVELNEQASIRRTSDILFHFRKAAKPLAEAVKAGDLARLKEALGALQRLRDDALSGPIGGTATSEQKQQAMDEFSAAVDGFVYSIQAGQTGDLATRYDIMMKAMERAYDLFL